MTRDGADRMRSLASVRRAREREKEKRKGGAQEQARAAREVVIPDVITVQELSNRMAVRAVDIIKFLMRQGMMLKINDVIDTDTAELVATEFGHTVKRVSEADVEDGFIAAEDEADDHLDPPARGGDHGPRRPRQDQPARRPALHRRGGRRSRRHHPAHRRLSGPPGRTASG